MLLAAVLMMSSCTGRLMRKISIDDVKNFRVLGVSGLKADFVFRNQSARNVEVESLVVRISEHGSTLLTLELREGFTIERRQEQLTIPTTWRMSDTNPMAALSATGRLLKPEANGGFRVDIKARIKAGALRHTIEQENLPLKSVLKSLNVTD